MRHLLFVYPGLVVLAAIGIIRLLRFVQQPAGRVALRVALVAGLAMPAYAMVDLHPFQTSYFNEFVGGLRGAAGRYYTDYWGTCVKQAVAWLEQEARRRKSRLDVSSNLYEEMVTWQVRNPESFAVSAIGVSS